MNTKTLVGSAITNDFHQRLRAIEKALGETPKQPTVRDYFIAHAPAEPQPWFKPVPPPKPVLPENKRFIGKCDHMPEYQQYQQECADYRSAMISWSNECEKQRFLQWPAAWADAMLAARGGK